MKKIFISILLLLFIFTVSGCNNPITSSNDKSSNIEDSISKNKSDKIEVSRTESYRIEKRQCASIDDNGDVYFITHSNLNKISKADGKIYTLTDGFEFGHDIDLHNNYIYYQIGSKLYRMDKTDKSSVNIQLNIEPHYSLVCFKIIGNTLCVQVYDMEKQNLEPSKPVIEYLYADISNDPTSLSCSLTNEELDFKKYENESNEYYSIIAKSEYNRDGMIVDVTEEYYYFVGVKNSGSRMLGRISIKTKEIEMLNIYPYQPEKTTVENGWIYYQIKEADKPLEMWRVSEDLTKNERLI